MQTAMVDFFFFFDEYGNLREKKERKESNRLNEDVYWHWGPTQGGSW